MTQPQPQQPLTNSLPRSTDESLSSQAQERAALAAAIAPRLRDDRHVASLVKKSGSLKEIKDQIREARKARCRTVQQYLCDACDAVITNPGCGFVVHGNIYCADPTQLGGLIGDNFPKHEGPIESSEVRKTVLCKRCFLDALGIEQKFDFAAGQRGKPHQHDMSEQLTRMISNR